MTNPSAMKKIVNLSKYAIAAIPIIWIFHRIDFQKLLEAFHKTQGWTLPLLTGVVLTAMFLQGFRWWILLRAFIPELSLGHTISCHFKGIFYSIMLPTSAAQDVVRTVLITRNIDYSVGWGATWICRILGLFALSIISGYGLLTIDRSLLPEGFLRMVFLAFAVVLLLMAASFSKTMTRPFRLFLQKCLPPKITAIPEKIRDGIYNYRGKKKEIFWVFLVTFFTELLFFVNIAFMIKGISGRFFLNECFAFFPIIEIISISLPLTPNGVGIREGLTAVMFKHLHLSNEQLGVYVIISFYTIFLRLAGAVPIVYDLFKKRRNAF